MSDVQDVETPIGKRNGSTLRALIGDALRQLIARDDATHGAGRARIRR